MSTFINVTVDGGGLSERAKAQTNANRQAKLEGDNRQKVEAQGREQRDANRAELGIGPDGQPLSGTPARSTLRRDEPAAARLGGVYEFRLLPQFDSSLPIGTLAATVKNGKVKPLLFEDKAAEIGSEGLPYGPYFYALPNRLQLEIGGGPPVASGVANNAALIEFNAGVRGYYDYLAAFAKSSDLKITTSSKSDFTWEFWVNLNELATDPNAWGNDLEISWTQGGFTDLNGFGNIYQWDYSPYHRLRISNNLFNQVISLQYALRLSGGLSYALFWYRYYLDGYQSISSNGSEPGFLYSTQSLLAPGEWAHFAICRKDMTLRLYVNGKAAITIDYAAEDFVLESNGETLTISQSTYVNSVGSSNLEVSNRISNMRFIKKALYVDSIFTPPERI